MEVGKTLADEILPTPPQTCKKYLRNRIQNSFFLDAPRPNEVCNIINSLKCKKSSKAKENVIPSYFIRVAGHLLAPYLNYFFTLSFDFGIFPDILTIAAVTPIHKTDSTTLTSNYCPISVLPCLSTILEKLIKTRLTSFLEKHSILYPKQYGFRTKHSTTHAVLDITTGLFDNINDKIFSCLVMLDLRKAFDTVSHE